MGPSKRLVALALFCFLASGIMFGQETREVNKTVPLTSDGKVYIDTYKGSINISAWDKQEVEIRVKIEPDEWDRDAEDKVKDTEIRIDATSSSVRIKSDYDKVNRHSHSFWGIFGGETGSLPLVHYTIRMPRTARLVVKDYKSKSTIADLRSEVEFDTYKGSAEFTNLEGSLTLETYKGDIRVDFADMKARSRVETYKGEIVVRLPKQKGFELDADVGRRGSFDSDFDLDRNYRSRRNRDYDYRGTVNGGGPLLSLKTDKGTLRLGQR